MMPKTKSKRARTAHHLLITHDEQEAMFRFWYEVQNISKVAAKFKRGASTIQRLIKRYKWKKRRDEMHAATSKKADQAAVAKAVSNLKLVESAKKGLAKIVLQKIKDEEIDATVRDLVLLLQLEETLKGNIGYEEQNTIVQIFNMDDSERDRLQADTELILAKLRKANRL
jgi:transposase